MFANRPRLAGTLVGVAVAIATTVVTFRTHSGRAIENLSFDFRMKNLNSLEPASPIVHIDIDDSSESRIGRWPWHRDITADLIRTLNELGAEQIVIDLLFPEPETPYIDPALLRDADSTDSETVIGTLSKANLVHPDLELASAIRDAGNVIMATQTISAPPMTPPPLIDRLEALRTKTPAPEIDEIIEVLGLSDSPETRRGLDRELLRLRIVDLLVEEFSLNAQQIADRLKADVSAVRSKIAGAKRLAADRIMARELSVDAGRSWDEIARTVLGERAANRSADVADLRKAYDIAVGRRQLDRCLHPVPKGGENFFRYATNIVPLYPSLSAAAADIADVSFNADMDGVVRRVPILIRYGDRVIEHMGLAAAARALGLDLDQATLGDDHVLTLPRKNGESVRLPLDAEGNLIIHWTKTAAHWRSGSDFPHIPAAKVLSIADARRGIRANGIARRYLMAELVRIFRGSASGWEGEGSQRREIQIRGDREYQALFQERAETEEKIRFGRLTGSVSPQDIEALNARLVQIESRMSAEEKSAAFDIKMQLAGLVDEPATPDPPEVAARIQEYRDGGVILDQKIPALDAGDANLRDIMESVVTELTPRIKDRHAFIGYAATAEGDIVSTSIDPQTNGVMCHAHVLNSILQRSFIQLPPAWLGAAISLVLGTLASIITSRRGPGAALFATAVLLVAYGALNMYWVFQAMLTWLVLIPPLVTIAFCWAFVTLFRQLTAERDKRLFRKQLSQYTSPAIAAKIAESPEAARAFKAVQTREMTCIFTDLKGFTTITERENAKVVQHVLNVYLERMSTVIWKHRGLINKFMGDGIMAFFNPSVDPLEDHARSACEASLAAMEELDRLKAEQLAAGDAEVFRDLDMRVGMATGSCMNGDLGSELKADYTVIGDVVNLAARLEPANKVFGTSILVSGPLHDAVKDAYEFRYLAELQVKGKALTVPVYEILGRKGAVDDATLEYARRFEIGVEMYKARKWDECIVHFTRILARRPDDSGASRYIDACQELKTFQPGEHWAGALELKEK